MRKLILSIVVVLILVVIVREASKFYSIRLRVSAD